jgi:hypothetical protein
MIPNCARDWWLRRGCVVVRRCVDGCVMRDVQYRDLFILFVSSIHLLMLLKDKQGI